MKSSRIILSILAPAMLTMALFAAESVADIKFHSEEYGFSFYYPRNWKNLSDEKFDGAPAGAADGALGFTLEELDEGQAYFIAAKKKFTNVWAIISLGIAVGDKNALTKEITPGLGSKTNKYGFSVVSEGKPKGKIYTDFMRMRAKKGNKWVDQLVYFIPLDGQTARLTFTCPKNRADTLKSGEVKRILRNFKTGPAAQEQAEFADKATGVSFKYPKRWKRFDGSQLSNLIDKYGAKSVGFSAEDAAEGRGFFIAAKDKFDNIWAVPSIRILVEDECPTISHKYKEARTEKEVGTHASFFKEYSLKGSKIVEVGGVDSLLITAKGATKPSDSSRTITVNQFIYIIPAGKRAIKLTFTTPGADTDAQEFQNATVRPAIDSLEGAKKREVGKGGVWVLAAIIVAAAAAVGAAFWLTKKKFGRLETGLDKRTYKHTGFQPKQFITKSPEEEKPGPKDKKSGGGPAASK